MPILKSLVVDDVTTRVAKAVSKAEQSAKGLNITVPQMEVVVKKVVQKASNKPFWLGVKFRACFVGILVPTLNHYFKLELDEKLVTEFFQACLAFAGFQAMSDFGKNK